MSPSQPTPPPAAPVPAATRQPRRMLWPVVGIAAVLLLAVAAVSWAVLAGRGDPPQIAATPRFPGGDDATRNVLDRLEGPLPEVTLSKRADREGVLHGVVHNPSSQPLDRVKLWVKSPKWDRVYEVKVAVENNATAAFAVPVAEPRAEVESFKVLRPREAAPPAE